MPIEIVVLTRQHVEVFLVERLAPAAGSVPETDLAFAIQSPQLVKNMGAHRRHAGTTTNEHHFGIGILGKELTIGS